LFSITIAIKSKLSSKSSQPVVASNIIDTESSTMANNTKITTQARHGQFDIKLSKMPSIENWLSHPEQAYDIEQIKSDTSSTSMPGLESSCSSTTSTSTINSASTSTSRKAYKAILVKLQRLRTKINLTIHYHHHTENSILFEDETQSDFPFVLPNFIQTSNYSPEGITTNSNNNGTFTPVGTTVNKHFVDSYYSHRQKQEAKFGDITPVGDSISPNYIDGEYINASDKHYDGDRRIPTVIEKNGKLAKYYARKGYDSTDEDGNILV
jgi:hypothetical protein